MEGKAGACVYAPLTGFSLSVLLGEHTIVSQAEVVAIKICCGTLETMAIVGKVYICSDSQAVLCALESCTVVSRLRTEYKNILSRLAKLMEVVMT